MAITKEDTARSYKGTVIGDNMVVSLNLKWLIQILTLCGMLVYSYYRIEMRIIELEDKFIEADTHIEDLLAKHEAEEAEKRIALEEQIKFYEKEFNINPLSWGKKKKKKLLRACCNTPSLSPCPPGVFQTTNPMRTVNHVPK